MFQSPSTLPRCHEMEWDDAGNTDFLISISPFHITVKSTKNDNESHEDTTRFGWSHGLILREISLRAASSSLGGFCT
jgi:hypothetical protein